MFSVAWQVRDGGETFGKEEVQSLIPRNGTEVQSLQLILQG
jgi:hypothetical protein